MRLARALISRFRQKACMYVDTCGHPPVSGQASAATASSPPRPHPRLGGQGRQDPPLILNAGRSGPRAAQPPKGPASVSLSDSGLRRSNDAGREAFGPGDYNALCFGRTSLWIFFFLVFLIT